MRTESPKENSGRFFDKLEVINIGLEEFYEALESQGVPVVQVDWQPPAAGDDELIDLLDRLL